MSSYEGTLSYFDRTHEQFQFCVELNCSLKQLMNAYYDEKQKFELLFYCLLLQLYF